MSHWLHPEAEEELYGAAAYYAEQANPAIALAFLAEYERVRNIVIDNQQSGPHAVGGFRLYHFDRFPYTLIYEENDERGPQIYAVAHQRREPGYWGRRP
jgi:plasmid stabilization system protein ParE